MWYIMLQKSMFQNGITGKNGTDSTKTDAHNLRQDSKFLLQLHNGIMHG